MTRDDGENHMPSGSRNTPKVNVAVVGVGYWGKNLVRNFHDLGALTLLCDEQGSVEASCKSDYENVSFCRDFRAVLSDPTIDAVALATPAVTHYEMARAALEAGKDVLVEKPLAIDVRHGEDLVKLAEARRRILMVGHILRYHPAILKLQKLIQDGALGKVHYLYSNRLNIGKIRTEENILWSFAPHDISVMLSLLDEMPNRVSCQGAAYLNRGIYDVTLSHFDFPSGVQAHIFVSWLLGEGAALTTPVVASEKDKKERPYFVHESAWVDEGVEVGAGARIWHFAHIMKGARIGERSVIGQNVNVDSGAIVGKNVKIQN